MAIMARELGDFRNGIFLHVAKALFWPINPRDMQVVEYDSHASCTGELWCMLSLSKLQQDSSLPTGKLELGTSSNYWGC